MVLEVACLPETLAAAARDLSRARAPREKCRAGRALALGGGARPSDPFSDRAGAGQPNRAARRHADRRPARGPPPPDAKPRCARRRAARQDDDRDLCAGDAGADARQSARPPLAAAVQGVGRRRPVLVKPEYRSSSSTCQRRRPPAPSPPPPRWAARAAGAERPAASPPR
eukprot:6190320-Pyramimonas_sp.AAC.1